MSMLQWSLGVSLTMGHGHGVMCDECGVDGLFFDFFKFSNFHDVMMIMMSVIFQENRTSL